MHAVSLTITSFASAHDVDALTDDALVAAVARGDRAALGALFARHKKRLRGVAAAVLGKDLRHEAGDVVSDVFLVLLDGRAATFQPARGKVASWLAGIARRLATERASRTTFVSYEDECERELGADEAREAARLEDERWG
jgi:RNA polymerase sigma-70 factor (ECF subfamily)